MTTTLTRIRWLAAASRRTGGAQLGLALLAGLGAAPLRGQDFSTGAVLRELRVHTRDVYDRQEADDNLLFRLANALHATTGAEFVRREVFLRPGERVTPEQVDELERNLRATDLFGEVRAELVDRGDGEADLEVWTRDRYTLAVNASAASVGGVTKVNGSIGERNLFGTGKAISISAEREDDDEQFTLAFYDPQLFGSWHQLRLLVGDATEGPFGSVSVRRPFKHLEDPWSYGGSLAAVDRELDYYRRGEVVTSVAQSQQEVYVDVARAFGTRDLRRRIGADMRGIRSDFGDVDGPEPGRVAVPGDVDEVQLGTFFGIDWTEEYLVEQRIDALDYDEDVRLGLSTTLRTALAWRDEVGGGGADLQPLLELDLRAAAAPLADTFVTFQFDGGMRWDDDEAVAWRVRPALHVFQQSLPAQTLALSLIYDEAVDRQGLPPQLTLGGDSGVRGYPARELAGDRLAVLNIEDRIFTGMELWSVHVGLAAFYDVGWIEDRDAGLAFSDPVQSAGFGLRFGSSELFGSSVFRVDFAWPLDDVGGESFGLQVTATVGQLFGFFGNARELSAEFDSFFR